MKAKTIFLTGATGFVGSNLTYEFLKLGNRVIILARDEKERAIARIDKIISDLCDEPEEYNEFKNRIEIISGDVTRENLGINSSFIHRLITKIDEVFHCAALTSFDNERRAEIEEVNVKGINNILDFILKLKQPAFHFISTAYVCGQKEGIFYEDGLDLGQRFNNPYEESKFKAEKLTDEYRQKFGIKTVIYRPTIIVGNSKTGKTSNFLGFYSIVRAVFLLTEVFKKDLSKDGRRALQANVSYKDNMLYIPLRVPGIVNKTLNIVPIDYVTEVIMRIFKTQNVSGKTYHIVNPNPPTVAYIQKIICSYFNISGIRIADPKEFQLEPMTEWESFFAKSLSNFAPYLQKEEPIFSDKNTQCILNGTSIKCPIFSERLIKKLIAYCIRNNWGKE